MAPVSVAEVEVVDDGDGVTLSDAVDEADARDDCDADRVAESVGETVLLTDAQALLVVLP